MSLCLTAALNAWDSIQESGKRIESNTSVKQGQREPFSEFLQRLTKAVQIGVKTKKLNEYLNLWLLKMPT